MLYQCWIFILGFFFYHEKQSIFVLLFFYDAKTCFFLIIFPLSHLHFSSVRQVISLSCHHACPSFSFLPLINWHSAYPHCWCSLFQRPRLTLPHCTHTHTHLHREWVCVGLLSKFGTLRCFFFLYRKLRQVQEIYISLICKFNKQTCACCLFSSNYVVSPELGFA